MLCAEVAPEQRGVFDISYVAALSRYPFLHLFEGLAAFDGSYDLSFSLVVSYALEQHDHLGRESNADLVQVALFLALEDGHDLHDLKDVADRVTQGTVHVGYQRGHVAPA